MSFFCFRVSYIINSFFFLLSQFVVHRRLTLLVSFIKFGPLLSRHCCFHLWNYSTILLFSVYGVVFPDPFSCIHLVSFYRLLSFSIIPVFIQPKNNNNNNIPGFVLFLVSINSCRFSPFFFSPSFPLFISRSHSSSFIHFH